MSAKTRRFASLPDGRAPSALVSIALDGVSVERRRIDFARTIISDTVRVLRLNANGHNDRVVISTPNAVSNMLGRAVAGLDSAVGVRMSERFPSARTRDQRTR